MAEAYLKEVTLPSKGYFYGDKLPGGKVTLEPMGTREEKLFATTSSIDGNVVIDKIYANCIHLPKEITHQELVLGDRLFLLLQLRSISYGNLYSFAFKCESCNERTNHDLDIDKLELKEAQPGSTGRFTVIDLPICKESVTLQLLTGVDEDKIRAYGKQVEQKTHGDSGQAEFIYRLARRIVEIGGIKAGIRECIDFAEKLRGLDSLKIRDAIDDNEVGPITKVEVDCKRCGWSNSVTMPLESEFFRPKRRRPDVRSDNGGGVVPPD